MLSRVACLTVVLFLLHVAKSDTDASSERQIINLIDKLDSEKNVNLFGGLNVEQINSQAVNSPRSEESLVDRIVRYSQNHQLKLDLTEARNSKNVGEGRGKVKKFLIPLLLALKLKAAVVLPVIFTVLAMISVKALTAGLLALLFSGANFAKDFFQKKQERVTTAYINANPGMSAEIVTDWNRNSQAIQQQSDAQNMAYNAYQTLPQNI